ncbi:hypothetical protein ACQKRQ_16530 [Paraburkholderia sp. NPDC080076]|uniref:hypothetical protein n=1 Tax=Paraburkholderia sp. NPDC080076 TaxID=3390605 RepID=UPI003D04E131
MRIFSHKTPIGQRLDESNHTVTNAGCFVNPNGLNGAMPIPELIASLVGGTSASVASGPPASSNPFGPLQSSLASLGLGSKPVGSLSTLLGGTPLAGLTSALSGTPLGSLTFSGFRGSPLNSLTRPWAVRVARRIRCRCSRARSPASRAAARTRAAAAERSRR